MFVHLNIMVFAELVAPLIENPGYLKAQFFMESFRSGVW
jgi:hypothetical protein